jgi:hypothetical protein
LHGNNPEPPMSALGQKQTWQRILLMSALPQKQTLDLSRAMSALCQKRTPWLRPFNVWLLSEPLPIGSSE